MKEVIVNHGGSSLVIVDGPGCLHGSNYICTYTLLVILIVQAVGVIIIPVSIVIVTAPLLYFSLKTLEEEDGLSTRQRDL